MSYNPTNWQNGDIITSEKLNNIESGISNAVNAVMKVHFTVSGEPAHETATSDKTYEQIMAAIEAGGYVYGYVGGSTGGTVFQLHNWHTSDPGCVTFWHWDDVDGETSPYYIYIHYIYMESDGTVEYEVNTLTVPSDAQDNA